MNTYEPSGALMSMVAMSTHKCHESWSHAQECSWLLMSAPCPWVFMANDGCFWCIWRLISSHNYLWVLIVLISPLEQAWPRPAMSTQEWCHQFSWPTISTHEHTWEWCHEPSWVSLFHGTILRRAPEGSWVHLITPERSSVLKCLIQQ